MENGECVPFDGYFVLKELTDCKLGKWFVVIQISWTRSSTFFRVSRTLLRQHRSRA